MSSDKKSVPATPAPSKPITPSTPNPTGGSIKNREPHISFGNVRENAKGAPDVRHATGSTGPKSPGVAKDKL